MTKFTTVQNDLYILKHDLHTLNIGAEVKGYINVSMPDRYELIDKYAFQPSIKVNDNTFLVTLIMK